MFCLFLTPVVDIGCEGITTDPTSSISTGGGAGNFFFFVLMNFLALVFSKAMILGLLLLTNSVATAMKVYILCVIIPYVCCVRFTARYWQNGPL